METYTFPTFPDYAQTIHIALFNNVSNCVEIRRQLIEASVMQGLEGEVAREALDYGFIDASLIVSLQHLMNAITATILTTLNHTSPDRPVTRSHNLHSEVLLALSLNNNITESLRRHGVGDNTSRLVLIRFSSKADSDAEKIWDGMRSLVSGDRGSVAELDDLDRVDWPRVDKVYKVAEMNQLKLPDVRERKRAAIETAVAIKSVT